MLATEREILHRLLTHFHPKDYEKYFIFFEEAERQILSKMTVIDSPLHLHLDNIHALFHKMHYSWFIEPLKKLPQEIIEHCLPLFSPIQFKGLSQLEPFKKVSREKNSPLHSFYISYLLKEIGFETIPPLCFLPHSESLQFLNFSKDQLVALIQHLGVLELANISKKIVDQKVLNRIEELLKKPYKKLYLNAKRSSEPKAATIRDLSKMLVDNKTLSLFIEKRGVERLARGLVSDPPYLIWHIAHILDQARGQQLLIKSRRFMPNPYTPFFSRQLLDLSQALQSEDAS